MKRNQSPEINTFVIDIENGVNANFKPEINERNQIKHARCLEIVMIGGAILEQYSTGKPNLDFLLDLDSDP
jgi:hypothetical protein